MADPADAPSDLDEGLEEHESDLADVDDEVRALIDELRSSSDASIRAAIRYSGDDHDLLYLREDLVERYTDAEVEERVETLVMKGLGDPPREEELFDFGTLDATVRWYDEVIVVTFPYREWSGLVFVFDRHESPIVDLAGQYLDDD